MEEARRKALRIPSVDHLPPEQREEYLREQEKIKWKAEAQRQAADKAERKRKATEEARVNRMAAEAAESQRRKAEQETREQAQRLQEEIEAERARKAQPVAQTGPTSRPRLPTLFASSRLGVLA
jgi:hypothetical protein